MPEITVDVLREIEAEYSKWIEFLNGGVGLLSFTFGLSCLGTPRPDISGFLSLIFIFGVYGRYYSPKRLKELRKMQLVGIDEYALAGLEKKYFGMEALFKSFPIYIIGLLFLGGVTWYGYAINTGLITSTTH